MTLKKYDISEDIFDKIVFDYRESMMFYITDNIERYFSNPLKHRVIYNGTNTLIVPERILAKYICIDIEFNCWKQVILLKSQVLERNSYECSIDGSRAWQFMIKLLKKYYTDEEIDNCLKSFQAEYDYNKAQFHYFKEGSPDKILKFENCYKYDINGAHNEALTIIFPKAKEAIIKMYLERKKHPVNKKYINFFVGMLCRKGYRETYNWIVQRVSAKLKKHILKACGEVLYANTDGFIVKDPIFELETSTELGALKLEYKGDICFYNDINYFCFQLSDKKITGNIRYQVRDDIDLFNGDVVHYILKKEYKNGEIIEHLENIRRENLNEKV